MSFSRLDIQRSRTGEMTCWLETCIIQHVCQDVPHSCRELHVNLSCQSLFMLQNPLKHHKPFGTSNLPKRMQMLRMQWGWRPSLNIRLEAIALRLEAIAIEVEAIGLRLVATLEAISTGLVSLDHALASQPLQAVSASSRTISRI